MAPVAKAVILFHFKQHGGNAPVGPGMQLFQAQGVFGAFFPGKGWSAGFGIASWHMHRSCRQRIAIVQVCVETATALHVMKNADKIPGHTGAVRNGLIPCLAGDDPVHTGINSRIMPWMDTAGVEELLVFSAH